MTRSILLSLAILGLTGCSELQVIGRAAVNELQTEAINVEWAAYQKQKKLAKLHTEAAVAKSDIKQPQSWGQNEARLENQQKGLWEKQ